MSSTHTKFKAELCINGKIGGTEDMCATQDTLGQPDPAPWFAIDYGDRVSVGKVVLANRIDCCGERTSKVEVRLSDELPTDGKRMFTGGQLLGKFAGPGSNGQKVEIKSVDGWVGIAGRYLIVQMDKTDKPGSLNLKEVTAFGVGPAKGQSGCVIEEKTDYNGHDIKMIKKVENHEVCAKLAAANEKAKFWTYQAASKKCWIKTSKKGKRPNKTVVSGNQECGV